MERWCWMVCSVVGERSEAWSEEPFSTMLLSASGLSWGVEARERFRSTGEQAGVLRSEVAVVVLKKRETL